MLQLKRKPGQSFTIKPGKGMDLSLSVGEVFQEMPIHVTLNRLENGSAKIGIVAHRELLIIRDELILNWGSKKALPSVRADSGAIRLVLANNVRKLRQYKGLEVQQIAASMGMALNDMMAVELGRGVISLDELARLAAVLGVKVGRLLRE